MSRTSRLLVVAAILQVVWGLVPGASKFVIDEIPVEIYIALRWSISGAIFAVYLLLAGRWRPVGLRDSAAVAALGVLGYGVASFGTLYGLKIGGVTNFALMSALGPLITSGVAITVLREKPRRAFYIALPMSVFGLVLVALGKYRISSFVVAGASVALILGGAFLEALVFVYSKKARARMSAIQYLAIAQIATAVFMWIAQLAYFKQFDGFQRLTATGFAAAIFVSVVACVLCYLVLYWLLSSIDGHRLALFDGFHTLSATVFGVLVFHEPLRPLMALGGLLVLLGLIVGNWPERARAGAEAIGRK